jgi:hypothetical protein
MTAISMAHLLCGGPAPLPAGYLPPGGGPTRRSPRRLAGSPSAGTRSAAYEAGALAAEVVDAHVVVVAARTGSFVLTADPDDLRRLSDHLPARAPAPIVER